jgi:predicted ATPase/DNA-binding CsgD family transcriptional regulator
MPARPRRLIGREREVEAALVLLESGRARLITVTGPGGIGKTHLALEVAADLVERFAAGVVFVDLAPLTDPVLVPSAIAQALGAPELGDRPPAEAVADALQGRRLLLLLDNFEHLAAAAPLVAALLERAPELTVVVTSREPLHLRWEHELPLAPLGQAESVALFVERARTVQPDFGLNDANATAVDGICARLDGLPLAIELAAARVRHFPPSALEAYLEQHRLDLLTGGPRDACARQQTLRSTIDWSYALLSPDERRLFARLAAFSGGCTLEAAAAVCGGAGSGLAALDGIAALVDKSLVRRVEPPGGEPRLAMLETIREYALDRLIGSGEIDEVRWRHAAHYLALAERAAGQLPGPEEVVWLDRLDAEYANLRSAVCWAIGNGAVERALRICVALGPFWRLRGHMHEALRWLEEALGSAGADVPPALRARGMFLGGRFAWSLGDHAAGQEHLRRSIALWREVGDAHGLADALQELGLQAGDSGDAAGARAALEESLALFRTAGDAAGTANALHGLGFRAEERGELSTAQELLEESLALRRALGHPSGLARTLNGLGIVARGRGDFARAEALHRESLALYRGLRHELGMAYALAFLGRATVRRGDLAQAAALGRESLALAWRLRNPWVTAEALSVLAAVAVQDGRAAPAVRLLSAVERLLGGTTPASATARAEHEAVGRRGRAALGRAFEAAWAAGQQLPLPTLIGEALAIGTTVPASDGADGTARAGARGAPPEPPRAGGGAQPLVEPLSERELEVLRLVAEGFSNKEVAARLIIAPGTVKAHLHHICGKLEVANRTAAVSRARQLRLL